VTFKSQIISSYGSMQWQVQRLIRLRCETKRLAV